MARSHGVSEIEKDAPVTFIGMDANLNKAENGLQRAADVLGLSVPEVNNLATIAGAIEIGRHPGSCGRVSSPVSLLEAKGLGAFAHSLYNL